MYGAAKTCNRCKAEFLLNAPIPPKTEKPQGKRPKGQQGAVPMVVPDSHPPKVVKDPAPPAKAPKKPAPQPAPPPPAAPPVAPTVPQSRLRLRHVVVAVSFLLMVIAPIGVSAWYLWTRAADQYASFVGFSVRTEDASSSLNLLLGPLDLGGETPDADILYEFIQSQDLVARVDEQLDLRTLWSKPGPDNDPVFAFDPPGTIEDLRDYWRRMVHISYDSGNGLIELRVHAFDPDDAQAIAQAVSDESTRLINDLSLNSREDSIRYAREELDVAVDRLKKARKALTEYRNRTQIVDPTIDVQGQAGLLSQLNIQLAAALIDLDMLHETTREGDPRIDQAERRIRVIEARIESEKRKLGLGGGNDAEAEAFADLVGEYESLVVDREFAERTYTAALASYDAAQAEAQRQSRYLAIHLNPTLAEKAEYPERLTLLGLIGLFSFLLWSVLALVGYSLRDRR